MSRLIKLTDGKIEVGVIPDLGGMVAVLRLKGMRNILKVDSALFDKPPLVRKTFGVNTKWEGNNGHIVWLGPQSEWWLHQNKNKKRKKERAVWPPDPHINHGYFDVISQCETGIVMRGQESEFSGVRLTKSISIKNGKVFFKVSAQNIRKTPVSWDLWLNTRVNGYARAYTPVQSLKNVRIDAQITDTQDSADFLHDGGYLHVTSRLPSKNKSSRWAKAFVSAQRGEMFAFASSQVLAIKFKRHSPKLIHREQALVELYNYTSRNKEDALTELEYHAPYKTLAPNETMEASQIWEVHPFINKPTHAECLKFLDRNLKT